MKRRTRLMIRRMVYYAVPILLALSPIIVWMLLPVNPLVVTVMTKTVPESDRREHHSLFWLLNHYKYANPLLGRSYDYTTDYYGYFPERKEGTMDASFDLSHTQLLYLADAYGVYELPKEFGSYEEDLAHQYQPARLLYGGITDREADEIVRYDSLKGRCIGEFNVFGSPMGIDARAKRKLERVFGVRYQGIWGKYYDDLNSAARWIKDTYASEYNEWWRFKGAGIIIIQPRSVALSRPTVTVLDASDLEAKPILLRKQDHPVMRNVATEIGFYYWFEILTLDSLAVPLATFEIRCRARGREKMRVSRLPLSFPAVVASDSTMRNFYFAGDFADNNVPVYFTRVWLSEKVFTLFSYLERSASQEQFLWRFYVPLMEELLERSVHATRR